MATSVVRAVNLVSAVAAPSAVISEPVAQPSPEVETSAIPGRTGAELVRASSAFEGESRFTTWRLLATTVSIQALLVGIIIAIDWWPAKALTAFILGLVQVRLFIFFHDTLHGAIFRNSKIGHALMSVVGFYVVAVRSVWKETHDYHHQNNAKLVGSAVGSFPVLSVGMRERVTPAQLRAYRLARHPLTILFGYVTVFLIGMTIPPFRRDPRRHWGAPLAALLHIALFVTLGFTLGWMNAFFLVVVAGFVAMALGSYLFYVQHNFPGMRLRGRRDWTHVFAALHSSSMFDMSRMMHWFTGNIGYHHVHHLNHRIPFYRLPEAMRAMPELHQPMRTSWRLRDIRGCLSMYLWDPEQDRMLTYAEARARGL